ncbi:DUF6225 family protein [Streptomyces sp. NPDC057575]|uniref:DUF6225 family protein n=1 Tax=unclassified Streptomyces TaxID=2593676 RepID=UPI0036C19B2D
MRWFRTQSAAEIRGGSDRYALSHGLFEHTPQVCNAAQLRDALKNLPDDAPSGTMPVPSYSSGSSDRIVSGSPAFTACQAIATACAAGQSTAFHSIASTAWGAVSGTFSANRRDAACLPAPATCRSAARADGDGRMTRPVPRETSMYRPLEKGSTRYRAASAVWSRTTVRFTRRRRPDARGSPGLPARPAGYSSVCSYHRFHRW